jgi:hypothetical protein
LRKGLWACAIRSRLGSAKFGGGKAHLTFEEAQREALEAIGVELAETPPEAYPSAAYSLEARKEEIGVGHFVGEFVLTNKHRAKVYEEMKILGIAAEVAESIAEARRDGLGDKR